MSTTFTLLPGKILSDNIRYSGSIWDEKMLFSCQGNLGLHDFLTNHSGVQAAGEMRPPCCSPRPRSAAMDRAGIG